MADERYTFETARLRLEEIASEVRKKDTSLEKSLDLLEEGVRLANICTDLVDHTDIGATVAAAAAADVAGVDDADGPAEEGSGPQAEASAADDDPGSLADDPDQSGDDAVPATDDVPDDERD